jgi:hypothetical protein
LLENAVHAAHDRDVTEFEQWRPMQERYCPALEASR